MIDVHGRLVLVTNTLYVETQDHIAGEVRRDVSTTVRRDIGIDTLRGVVDLFVTGAVES